ncbi:B-cell receptor CD22-like [Sardina pilchardus]|uniref:B-cell receptor CD22-like n=1 Tax=Sardina pilchardus TaxID=27697 RepID=UPI002E0E4E52
MTESHPPKYVVLSLLLIQGTFGQQWGINITDVHICAVRGSSMIMLCSFMHPPGLRVTKVFWTINPQRHTEPTNLLDIPQYKDRVVYSADIGNNCTLTLRELTVADAGVYHLRIVTEQDKEKWLQQPGFRLTVTDLSVWILGPVLAGNEVEVSCNNSCELEDNATVLWKKNGQDVSGDQTTYGRLLLTNVSTEADGDYSCALMGFDGHPSATVDLKVMFPPKDTSVSVSPSSETLEGSSVSLTCSSDANPPVENYTWFKVGDSTPVGSGQQYSISYIRSEDGGQYYCEARNEHGAENSTAVSITVTDIVRQRYTAFVIIGILILGIVSLSCTIHWIRGRSGDEDPQGHVDTSEGSKAQDCTTQYASVRLISPVHRYLMATQVLFL